MEPHPIRVVVKDDLDARASRSSSGSSSRFRTSSGSCSGSIAAFFVAFVNWVATLVSGRLPRAAVELPRRLRALLDAPLRVRPPRREPLPRLHGEAGDYPVDLEVDGPGAPEPLDHRLSPDSLPARLPSREPSSSSAPGGGGRRRLECGRRRLRRRALQGRRLRARAHRRLPRMVRRASPGPACRTASATCSRTRSATAAQTLGYVLVLTDRYPNSDPREPVAAPPPPRPVELVSAEEDLRR